MHKLIVFEISKNSEKFLHAMQKIWKNKPSRALASLLSTVPRIEKHYYFNCQK
jgi:hypothetical protein